LTTDSILSGLDYHTTAWATLAAEYYRLKKGEAGKRCDEYAALTQAAAQKIRELEGAVTPQ